MCHAKLFMKKVDEFVFRQSFGEISGTSNFFCLQHDNAASLQVMSKECGL